MKSPFKTVKATSTSTSTPVAEVVIKLGDLTIATRSIWQESTSRNQAASDLNQMALENPEQLLEILKQHASKFTFEIRDPNQVKPGSLEDLLGSL